MIGLSHLTLGMRSRALGTLAQKAGAVFDFNPSAPNKWTDPIMQDAAKKQNDTTMQNLAGVSGSWMFSYDNTHELRALVNSLGADGNFGVDSNADGLADGWSNESGVHALTNNVQRFTAASQFDGIYSDTVPVATGDILYACARITASSSFDISVGFSVSGGGVASKADATVINGVTFVSHYYSVTSSYSALGTKIYDHRSSAWDYIDVELVTYVNLTAIFGAGNEPTQATLDRQLQTHYATGGAYIGATVLDPATIKLCAVLDGTDDFGIVGKPAASRIIPYIVNLMGDDGNFGADSNLDGVADGWTISMTVSGESVAGNVQTFTPAEQYGGVVTGVTPTSTIYCCAFVKSTSSSARLVSFASSGGDEDIALHSGGGGYEFLSTYRAHASTSQLYINDSSAVSWSEIAVKKALRINVTTLAATIGYTPTKFELDLAIQWWYRNVGAYLGATPPAAFTDDLDLDGTTSIYLATCMRSISVAPQYILAVGDGENWNTIRYGLRFNNGECTPMMNGVVRGTGLASVIPLNMWVDVVVEVLPSGVLNVYLDGLLDYSTTAPLPLTRSVGVASIFSRFGSGADIFENFFAGQVGSVSVYNDKSKASVFKHRGVIAARYGINYP